MKKLVLFILCVVCILCLCSCIRFNIRNSYADSNKYTPGSFSYRAKDVSKISISYISGDVTIIQSNNGNLNVTETEKGLSDAQKVHWYLDGHTLRIKFCKSGYSGRIPQNSKNLTVEIPYGIELEVGITSGDVKFATDIEVKRADFGATSGDFKANVIKTGSLAYGATSGSISISALYADSANFGQTSGNVSVSLIHADRIAFGSTSGSTTLSEIYASEVIGGATSGNVTLSFEFCEKLKVDCTSGNITIKKLPANGATITYDKTSGKLRTGNYMVKNDRIVFGDGGCVTTIVTTSGDLIIE
ncbi:MAG: DUF4097 family beta strand repeat protein [Spirochaetales bacterium]|nr:DUF4097 family beta strand repeat protein [Spirochaetales bacterium]